MPPSAATSYMMSAELIPHCGSASNIVYHDGIGRLSDWHIDRRPVRVNRGSRSRRGRLWAGCFTGSSVGQVIFSAGCKQQQKGNYYHYKFSQASSLHTRFLHNINFSFIILGCQSNIRIYYWKYEPLGRKLTYSKLIFPCGRRLIDSSIHNLCLTLGSL